MEGEGANGKSVVCEILTAMLGEENVSNVPLEIFGERFQLAASLGKLANIASEVGELKSVAEGFLKQFTGGDRMLFDRKGLLPIHARPTARLVLATNNRPRFSDRSAGLWRRMILLPFNVTIPPRTAGPGPCAKVESGASWDLQLGRGSGTATKSARRVYGTPSVLRGAEGVSAGIQPSEAVPNRAG